MVKPENNDKNYPIIIILNGQYTVDQQLEIEKRLCSLATNVPEHLVCVFYLGSVLKPDQNSKLQLLESHFSNIKMIDLSDYTYTHELQQYSFNVFVGRQTKNMHEKSIPVGCVGL